tara:strand:- start:906 stop:1088 length:183 start_codon:yes stop_codon:yes gene_type:complete
MESEFSPADKVRQLSELGVSNADIAASARADIASKKRAGAPPSAYSFWEEVVIIASAEKA